MNQDFEKILQNIRSVTIATVNEDGSPWVTPLLCYFVDGKCTWRSAEDAVHSQNIARDSRIAISGWYEDKDNQVFEALYISTRARMVGNATYSEQYQKELVEYEAPLGELDAARSEPNRYYLTALENSA